jgi:hypothetical protein
MGEGPSRPVIIGEELRGDETAITRSLKTLQNTFNKKVIESATLKKVTSDISEISVNNHPIT